GWVEATDLESVAQVASSRTASADTGSGGSTPGPRTGAPGTPGRGSGVGPPDSSAGSSAPVDPARVESARRTVLYRVPEGPPTGRTRFLGNPVLDMISLETLP